MNVIAIRQQAGEMMNLPPEDNGELGAFSLKWIFAFLVRRRIIIAATAIFVFILCFTAFLFQRPVYTATALVMINPGQEQVLNQDQAVIGSAGVPTAQIIDSEIEVLRSRMLAERLVDSLGLVNDPEWNSHLEEGAATPQGEVSDAVRQDVVEGVGKAIDVSRRGLTFAAEVSVVSGNAEQSAQMANRLVELFQQYQMESRIEAAGRANEWLSVRVQELRADVQAKEAIVERYRAEMGLISTQGSLLTEQQTTELQGNIMQAQADLAEAEARYAQVQRLVNEGGSLDSTANVLNSPLITQLRAQEAEIARRQADLENRYGENHPTLLNARAEREDIRRQIQAEVTRIAASMRNDVEVARARLGTLQASMNSMRGQLAGNNEQMVQLREYEREAAAARRVYEDFLTRFHEITDQGSMRTLPAELISAATVPLAPSSPRLSIAFLLSLGLAMGLGLAVGFLVEALDDGLGGADEIERKTGVAALASIPKIRRRELRQSGSGSNPGSYLLERQMSAFTEAFRVLRTTIMYAGGQSKSQVVAITSAMPNEGKTTVSLCLSRVSALSGQRVLLIDCDLRRRSLKEVLDIEPPVGLLQVLSGEAKWRDALYVDEASGLSVLPLAGWGFTPKEIFGAEDMSRLLEELRQEFDLIVLDCAPVLAVAETRVAVAKADCAVVVTRWRKTPLAALRSTLQQLHDAGANIRGIALNSVDQRAPGYYSYPAYDFGAARR